MNKDYYRIGEDLAEFVNSIICTIAYSAGLGEYTLGVKEGTQKDLDQDEKNCEEFFRGFRENIKTEIPW